MSSVRRSAFLLMLATGTLFNLAANVVLMALMTVTNPLLALLAGECIPVLASIFAIACFGPWVLQRTASAHVRAVLAGAGCVVAAIIVFGLVEFMLVRGARAWAQGLLPTEPGFYDFILEGKPLHSLMLALVGPLVVGTIGSCALPEILGGLVGHWVWARAPKVKSVQEPGEIGR